MFAPLRSLLRRCLLRKAEPRRTAVTEVVDARAPRLARKLQRRLQLQAQRIATIAVKRFKQFAKADKKVEDFVIDVLNELQVDDVAVAVVDELSAELEARFSEAGIAALAQVKVDASDDLVNHLDEQARAYVAERGAELVGKKLVDGRLVDNPDAKWSIAQTTRDELQGVLTDAVEQGWSATFLRDAIESSGEFSEWRSLMIARTEVAMAHVAGNVEGWRASGEVEGKRSILGDLHDKDDVCDDCADAGVVDLDDDFVPGYDFPPYHPSCECDILPVLRSNEGD